eukprot:gene19519-21449_t
MKRRHYKVNNNNNKSSLSSHHHRHRHHEIDSDSILRDGDSSYISDLSLPPSFGTMSNGIDSLMTNNGLGMNNSNYGHYPLGKRDSGPDSDVDTVVMRGGGSAGFQSSPIGSPDLNFSSTGAVVKHRHRNQELRKRCSATDVCSQCPLADLCMDRSLQEAGFLEKSDANEVFEWQKDWVELLRANIALNVTKTKQRINETFDGLVQALEKRRKELLRKTDIEGKKKLGLLNMKSKDMLQMQEDDLNTIEEVPKLPVAVQQYPTVVETVGDVVDNQKTTIASIKGLRVFRVGNLHFSCDDNIVESFSKFGEIGENLASAIHSEAVGLGLYYGLVGEEATFRVITRNAKMQLSFMRDDNVKVQVRGPGNSLRTADVVTNENAAHCVSFKPTQPGCHDFHIYVNNLELPESPFCCHVYEKEKLTFDQEPIVAYGSHLDAQGQSAWTVQKDGKSALLTKSSSSGAIIHAAQQFSERKHAWKVKFTSACPMVRICLGASSRTNIFDVDIEHTCDFNLGITKYGPTTERRKSRSKRRSSIYKRESRTYMVLLDMKNKRLTIVCCETEEGKHLTLPDQSDSLYPCVFMTHECKNEACPRPVVTFL